MRVLVLWCPDWPVVAAAAEEDLPRRVPVAVLAKHAVYACNDQARAEGVRRGMRRRDAQSRCPELVLIEANPERDARVFEPVLTAVEELRPGVAPLRPGLLAIRAPGRFYGGEGHAAAILAERLVEAGVWDVRIGVADDVFTAEQAARKALVQEHVVVEQGESAAFLCELPVEVLDDGGPGTELTGLLRRLGLRTLGELAALPAADVLTRFGAYGARVHRLAGGSGPAALATRTPPPELAVETHFEPPLDSIETVCFSVRRTADELVSRLARQQLVCTAVRIETETDRGTLISRSWLHAGWFTSADIIDRMHWQLQAAGPGGNASSAWPRLDGPVARVRFVPENAESAGDHAEVLWGGGADERVQRGIAKVQAMLGYDSVCRPVRQGGRAPVERQALVPWGEPAVGLRDARLPWPGSVPDPAPSRVFAVPLEAEVLDHTGHAVRLSERGAVSGVPASFRTGVPDVGWQPVTDWAGPWPVDDLWWERPSRLVARFQLVGADGRAWLLRCETADARWWTEAGYD